MLLKNELLRTSVIKLLPNPILSREQIDDAMRWANWLMRNKFRTGGSSASSG